MTHPFLVTGCGRSGTGWASKLFTTLGYPCGHEAVFNPAALNGPVYSLFEDGLTAPDSSWLAMPYVRRLPEGTPIIRMLRNPYYVVQSTVERGFLADLSDPYAQFVQRHRPDITAAPDAVGRAIRWACLWDESILDVDHYPFQVETGNVARAVEYATGDRLEDEVVQDALVLVGNDVNTNVNPVKHRPLLHTLMDHPDGALLERRSALVGYPN